MTEEAPAPTPFAKHLAANEKKTRDKAVESLSKYLAYKQTFSEFELLKLWKALFYCMWMADKPEIQQQLASTLAALQLIIRRENAIHFIGAFWDIICREWNGIDRLRLDKYYLFVRFFISNSFKMLSNYKWEEQLVDDFVELLSSGPLHPTNAAKKPDSIKFHIADVYLNELEKLFKGVESKKIPSTKLLYPFYSLLASTRTKSVFERIQETVFEYLVDNAENSTFEYDMGSIAKHLFTVGSDPNTLDANRRRIYQLYGKFEKWTDDEAPLLVTINHDNEKGDDWKDTIEEKQEEQSKKRTSEPDTNGKLTKKSKKKIKHNVDIDTVAEKNTSEVSSDLINKPTIPVQKGVLINPRKLEGKALRKTKRVSWGGSQTRTISRRK